MGIVEIGDNDRAVPLNELAAKHPKATLMDIICAFGRIINLGSRFEEKARALSLLIFKHPEVTPDNTGWVARECKDLLDSLLEDLKSKDKS